MSSSQTLVVTHRYRFTYLAELRNKSFDIRYYTTYACVLAQGLIDLYQTRSDVFLLDEIERCN